MIRFTTSWHEAGRLEERKLAEQELKQRLEEERKRAEKEHKLAEQRLEKERKRAEEERQQKKLAEQRAEEERRRAELLAAKLKELGVNPDEV